MTSACAEVERLRIAVQTSEAQLARLKKQLAQAENRTLLNPVGGADPYDALTYGIPDQFRGEILAALGELQPPFQTHDSGVEHERYSSQIRVPEIGVKGQEALGSHSVLVIGLGDIGCTAAAHLAGAGVGKIGVMDGARVERSSLYRQSLYDAAHEGVFKADALIDRLRSLNGNTDLVRHCESFSGLNFAVISDYDAIIDCTGSPPAQVDVSDGCIALRRPLIIGASANGCGQLLVLNSPPRVKGNPLGGPCARCSKPSQFLRKIVTDANVQSALGPVDGIIGSLVALEAMKVIISGSNEVDDVTAFFGPSDADSPAPVRASYVEFSAFGEPHFRTDSLGERDADCVACGDLTSGEFHSNL